MKKIEALVMIDDYDFFEDWRRQELRQEYHNLHYW